MELCMLFKATNNKQIKNRKQGDCFKINKKPNKKIFEGWLWLEVLQNIVAKKKINHTAKLSLDKVSTIWKA